MNDCILDEAVCKEWACLREAYGRYGIGRRTGLDEQHLSPRPAGKGEGIVQGGQTAGLRSSVSAGFTGMIRANVIQVTVSSNWFED
jgi:hypothetical protein